MRDLSEILLFIMVCIPLVGLYIWWAIVYIGYERHKEQIEKSEKLRNIKKEKSNEQRKRLIVGSLLGGPIGYAIVKIIEK